MPSWAVLVLVVLAVLALAAGVALCRMDRREAAGARAEHPPARPAAYRAPRVPMARSTIAPEPYVHPDRRLIAPPPMVGDLPLRDWLVHYSPRGDQVWPTAVATFYERAAAVPEIADYFRDTDMVRLQRHFARALTMLTGNGLTEGTLRRLQDAHFAVTDSRGRTITPAVYDAAVATLLAVLVEHGVPQSAIEGLAVTAGPLREVIARPEPSDARPRA